MKLFIVGKNGFIAKRFSEYVSKIATFSDVVYTSSSSDQGAINLNLENPAVFNYELIAENDIIVLFAAISSPDVCSSNYNFAYNINVTGTKYFIEQCLSRKARVLFFSSDTVYGLSEGISDENSICTPIGEYAQMKHEIETTFINDRLFKVFRLSYVFAKEDKFMSYMINCSLNGKTADIFHPFFRNVIYIEDLLEAIVAISNEWDSWSPSVFNLCGSESLSRLDLATMFREIRDTNLNYSVTTPSPEFFKARPQNIRLSSVWLSTLIKRSPTKIKEAMTFELIK